VGGATFEDLIDVSFDDDEMFIDARILGPPLGGVGDEVVTYRKQFVAPGSGTYQIRVRFENEFGPYVAFDGGELIIEGNVTSLGAVKVPAMGTRGLLGLAGLSLMAGLVLLQRQQS
jgi:hypothetical protein